MEVLEQRIKYNGKTYTVGEPTLDVYMAIQKEIDYASDLELAINLLSWITGLRDEEIKEADAYTIITAAEGIIQYYNSIEGKFYETFEFNGKSYKFIDLKGMSFGEYVDIDTFLQKPTSEKQGKLHELMAMLYREVNEKGEYKPYNAQEVKERAMEFKTLPLKYFNGALFFFSQYRQYVSKSYPALFSEAEDGEDMGDDKNPFGWYATIIYLAGEDLLKTEDVVKKNHIEVFNYLTYMTHLNNKRERELNKKLI